MIQIRAGCKNKRCTYFAQIQTLNLPVVGHNIEAMPTLICSGCRNICDTRFVEPEREGIIIDKG